MRLPAYARDLMDLQRGGKNIAWLVIALDWDIGRALPRIVVPNDVAVGTLDLSMLNGIECTVAHRGNSGRALDLADLALRNGAIRCGVFDVVRGITEFTTADVLSIRGGVAA